MATFLSDISACLVMDVYDAVFHKMCNSKCICAVVKSNLFTKSVDLVLTEAWFRLQMRYLAFGGQKRREAAWLFSSLKIPRFCVNQLRVNWLSYQMTNPGQATYSYHIRLPIVIEHLREHV